MSEVQVAAESTLVEEAPAPELVVIESPTHSVTQQDPQTVVFVADRADPGPVITVRDEPAIVREAVESVFVLAAGNQGPEGQPGQAGVGYVTYLAQGPLGGHRAVCAAFSLYVRYADSGNVVDAGTVLGITLNAAADNDTVNVATSGEIVEPSWAWTEGLPIFVGANGGLTQTPPTTGFQLIVGVATSPTSILVGIKQPIIL